MTQYNITTTWKDC